MAQLSDDCFAFGGELMRTDEALALLTERLSVVVDREDCALRDAAGRILAEDVTSARAVRPATYPIGRSVQARPFVSLRVLPCLPTATRC
jgi:hypothetical protein